MAAMIGSMIREHYKDYITDDTITREAQTPTTKKNMKRGPESVSLNTYVNTRGDGEDSNSIPIPSSRRAIEILNDDENSNLSAGSSSRTYKPPARTSSWVALLALYLFEEEKKKKYASKKDIRDMIPSLNDVNGPLICL